MAIVLAFTRIALTSALVGLLVYLAVARREPSGARPRAVCRGSLTPLPRHGCARPATIARAFSVRIGRVRVSRGWVVLAAPLACEEAAPDLPQAEFAEVCGVEGPVQVLALDERSLVMGQGASVLRVADRYLYVVRRVPEGQRLPAPADAFVHAGAEATIESVDRCGADHRVIAEDFTEMFAPLGEDGPHFATGLWSGQLAWFDPRGRWRPIPIGTPSRWKVMDPHTVIVWRGQLQQLSVVDLVGDGQRIDTHVLAEGLGECWIDTVVLDQGTPYVDQFYPPLAIESGTALGLTTDGDVLSIDIRTRTVETVLQGVYEVIGSGRDWIAWMHETPADEVSLSHFQYYLYDRGTRTSRLLYESQDATRWVDPMGPALLFYDPEPHGGPTEILWLPSLATTRIDGDWTSEWSTAQGDIVLHALGEERRIAVTRIDDDVRIVELPTGKLSFGSDRARWREVESPEEIGGSFPYDLYEVMYATGETRLVESRVRSDVALSNDRWLQVEDPDLSLFGRLVVRDGADGELRRVDDDVQNLLDGYEPHVAPGLGPWHTRELVYRVSSQSPRAGLWRVRFAD